MFNTFHEKTIKKLKYDFMAFILSWSGLMVLMSMFITIPLTSVFMTELHISTTESVWLGSAYSICYAVCCLLYGPLSDKFGRKIFLVNGIIILTAATFAIGFTDNYYVLLVLRAVQGISAAAFAPVSLVYAGGLFPFEKRVTVIGFITSGFLMASVIAQLFATVILAALGWQAIFIAHGILYFITALLVIFGLPKDHVQNPDEPLLHKFMQMKGVFKNQNLVLTFSITFMPLFSLVGMYTILGTYLVSERFGFSEQQVFYVRALGLIGMLTTVFAGKIIKRFGILTAQRSALALAAISLLAMGVSPSSFTIILCSVLFVAGITLIVPVNISLVSEKAGAARGSAVLFNTFILFLGASLGPMLAAKLMEVSSFAIAFSVFSVILFAGLLVSLLIQPSPIVRFFKKRGSVLEKQVGQEEF
mgnify:CR=1 FL=1